MTTNRHSSDESRFNSRASEPPVIAEADDARRLDRISRRAYELYEARGGSEGRSVDDWLQAEREIDSDAGELQVPSR